MKNIYYFFISTIILFILTGLLICDKVYATDYISFYRDPVKISDCNNCNTLEGRVDDLNSTQRLTIYQQQNAIIKQGSNVTIEYVSNYDFIYSVYLHENIINMLQNKLYIYVGKGNNLTVINGLCDADYYVQRVSENPAVVNQMIKTYSIKYTCNIASSNADYDYVYVTNDVSNNFDSLYPSSTRFLYLKVSSNYISVNTKSDIGSDDIINNQNSNTQDIIINQNSNTQDIINNQNQNQQQTNQNLQDINNSLTNSNVDSGLMDNFLNNDEFDDFEGLQDIITLPLQLVTHLGDTCSPITLSLPYFGNVVLPCPFTMYQKILGRSRLTIVRTIINGFVIYRILIDLFYLVKNAKDPNVDKIEVVEL